MKKKLMKAATVTEAISHKSSLPSNVTALKQPWELNFQGICLESKGKPSMNARRTWTATQLLHKFFSRFNFSLNNRLAKQTAVGWIHFSAPIRCVKFSPSFVCFVHSSQESIRIHLQVPEEKRTVLYIKLYHLYQCATSIYAFCQRCPRLN